MPSIPHDRLPAYLDALNLETDSYEDALEAIRAEQAEGRLTASAAAAERAGLLEAHQRRLAALREQYQE
jgi:hypothetical protein